jgi:protein-L-isoaspartate(D-aspartate) O-methyltransferase
MLKRVYRCANAERGMDNPDNEALTPEQHRQALVEHLKSKDESLDPVVEAAFLRVPRHIFLPDEPLDRAYSDDAVPIKRDPDGTVLSSSSQPSMMALMLKQLRLRLGDNVLEIGAGSGYNAAVMHNIVGDRGTITSIEIDKDVATAARNHLMRAGIASSVTIVDADGAMGYAPRASYDRIIATVGIWDVPAAWAKQLKPDGILVAPILIDGFQVSAAFTSQDDGSLYSKFNAPCGFISLRGLAAGPQILLRISTSGLTLVSTQAAELDSAAVHTLLSEDIEMALLEIVLTPSEYWFGLLPYLALHTPEGYTFGLYMVGDTQQAYSLEGSGFALIAPGSACFVPYHSNGEAKCFASADAFLALNAVMREWDATGRPSASKLRLRLTPRKKSRAKSTSTLLAPHAKIYTRKDHHLYVWLDI